MEAPDIPDFEEPRLDALYKLEVLDTPPEEGFDRLARMAKAHFGVSICSIALVDLDRIWFKAVEGLDLTELPREGTICARAILSDDILLVPDLLKDPQYQDSPPTFDGKAVRFYAGVPITVDGGFNVGCLNIMDWEPREFTYDDYEVLKDFGMLVAQQFVQRRFEQDSRFLVSQTMRLNTVLETVADGILTIDDEGRIESLNTSAAAIFGYDRFELEGASFHDLMPDLGRGGWSGYLKIRAENKHRDKDGTSVEIKGRRKTGELFPMDLRVREMFVDGHRLYTGIIRDITQEKANRDEVERGRQILETTKENVPVGITVFDDEGRLVIKNSRFTNLLDLPERLTKIGISATDIVEHLVDRGDFGDLDEDERRKAVDKISNQPLKPQYLSTKPNGRYIEISSRPMPGGGLVSIYSDLTMRLRYEERLEKALQEANRANEAKTNFLSTISHEIRTPLNGVIGVSQMLADSHLDQDQREKVDAILRSGKTLLELINDVLDMNKIESGNIELENILFSLHDTVQSIKQPFMLQSREKGISFNVLMDEDVPETVKSDPVRFRQILMNLLGNALKFTERGSVDLLISTGSIQADGAQSVTFKIIDTGVGIPKDRQEQVFESFSQADTSIGRQFGGTGLGLSIVKKLVEMLGGSINLVSEVGHGSCFEVSMPFHLPNEEELAEFLSEKENSVGEVKAGLKVLVAEDNDVNAMVTTAFLKKMNCSSVVAEDGLQAL
ncbi:MAG: PAS-domain containing protein, partial [Sneathiella sp.]|nr:PAS-domain containing protein [Sneathiella sp.]